MALSCTRGGLVRKTFFIGRLVKQWNRLLREVVKLPSLEVFHCRCGTLGHGLVVDLTILS